MKQLTYHISIFAAALLLLAACSKDEISSSPDAAPGVYFIYRQTNLNKDSITYTFVEKSSTTLKDTLWMPVRISGNTADRERPITLSPMAGTTAVKDVHYKLLSYSIPKDSFQTQLGIVLLRDASLRDTSVVLKLRLQPTADFTTPMKDTLMGDGNYVSRNEVKIIFTDRLLKPSNWESYLTTFFGAYSSVKFRFIAGVLGVSSFPTTGPDAVNFPRMQYYQNTVRNALVEYNATHSPLTDENGNTVVIP